MNNEHFKLGLFVIVATVLLVTMLFLLGTLERFRPSIQITTYFAEPIVGLQTGAAVRYRGVSIGTVGAIDFVRQDEMKAIDRSDIIGTLIRVRMDLDPRTVPNIEDEGFPDRIALAIDEGLRARMSASGLGGPTYIELDYVDAARAMPIPTVPTEGIVIPATPSTIRTLVTGLERLLADVNDSGMVANLNAIGAVAPELEALLASVRQADVVDTAEASLTQLQDLAQELGQLVSDERLDRLIDETTSSMASVRALADDGRTDLDVLTPRVVAMAEAVESATVAADALVDTIVESGLVPELRTAAGELGPAGRELTAMADRLDRLIASNDTKLAETITALRRSLEQLDALLEEAEANPSRILFGDAPPRREGDRP